MSHGRDDQTPQLCPFDADQIILAGICGSGVQSFYRILTGVPAKARPRIIGTDIAAESISSVRLRWQNLHIEPWHSDWSHILTPQTIVVHSVAVPMHSPVLTAASHAGCRILAMPEALGLALRHSRQVCVAGTHGKTTTTGLVSWILQQAQVEFCHYIGGEVMNERQSATPMLNRNPGDSWAVVESCEYRDSFLTLQPDVAVLTGIEPDHFDCFKTIGELHNSFMRFLARGSSSATVIVNQKCTASLDVARAVGHRVVTYSVIDSNESTATADWCIRALPGAPIEPAVSSNIMNHQRWSGQRAALYYRGQCIADLLLRIVGRHNLQNAVAGIAAAAACGVSPSHAASFAETFAGMKRRFEYRGYVNQAHWIDDYAHHPTAIRATLGTAKCCFPNKRIIAVIEPHQISRLENLFDSFVKSVQPADEIIVLPVLPARENASLAACQRLSGRLVRAISESGHRALLAANLDQAIGRLDHAVRPGDVVITMGAGRTDKIHDEIHRRLQRNSAA